MGEQVALGAVPEHSLGAAHVVVVLTYGQLFESTRHVATV
jgi:hypothetical protein